jgi:hypothetical protein
MDKAAGESMVNYKAIIFWWNSDLKDQVATKSSDLNFIFYKHTTSTEYSL